LAQIIVYVIGTDWMDEILYIQTSIFWHYTIDHPGMHTLLHHSDGALIGLYNLVVLMIFLQGYLLVQ